MAAAGFDTHTHRLPNPSDPDHLASLEFTALPLVTDAHRRRAEAILRRRTDRRAFAAPKIGSRLNPCCAARSMLRPRCLMWWPRKLVRDWHKHRG